MSLYADLPAAAQVARAVRGLGGPGHGVVLGYHPVARMNPFQALLYSRGYANEVAPVALPLRADLAALEVARSLGTATVLHLHWTSDVLSRAKTADNAKERAEIFLGLLEQQRNAGTHLVWTVHNVLPHQCPFPDIEASMRQALLGLVDVVHVMAPETVAETQPVYRIPTEKVIDVPHPSYLGAYPNHHDSSLAKFDLGYEQDDLIAAVVGSIQPYKGIDDFAASTELLVREMPRLRALVAGIPGSDEDSRSLMSRLNRYIHLDVRPRKLDAAELSLILTSLSAVVLPYRASLNSGAALLALSFGKPIVAPLIGHFRTLIQAGFGLGYDPESETGLIDAIRSLPPFLQYFDRTSALSYCESISGQRVSDLFFGQLLARLSPQ